MRFLVAALLITLTQTQIFAFEVLPANTIALKDYNKDLINLKPISEDKAQELFNYIKDQKNIPTAYLADGCHARTQQITDLIGFKRFNSKKIDVAKIVIEPKSDKNLITYRSETGPWELKWTYHMAPVVNVNGQLLVYDFSLFKKPVTIINWKNKVLKDTDNVNNYQSFYINKFTFRPSLKTKRFKELPKKLDRSIAGFLSQFKRDYEKYGAYLENCILKVDNQPPTVGGLTLDKVPLNHKVDDLPICHSL